MKLAVSAVRGMATGRKVAKERTLGRKRALGGRYMPDASDLSMADDDDGIDDAPDAPTRNA